MNVSLVALIAWLIAATALFTGCRPSDASQWKVSAETPRDMSIWQQDNLKDFPEDLLREYNQAIKNLLDYTPGGRSKKWDDPRNPVCNLIHRATVREVVVFGYNAHRNAINTEAETINGQLLRLMAAINAASSDMETTRGEQQLEYLRQRVAYWDEQMKLLEKHEQAFLRRSPGKK